MKASSIRNFNKILGAGLVLWLMTAVWAQADTVALKDGRDLKGLVVERHEDRVILSTPDGEKPVFLSDIKDIEYDEPEQNYFELGKSSEAAGRYDEALGYYQKALDAKPDFEEAKKAILEVKNRGWAQSTEEVRDDIARKQAIQDFQRGVSPKAVSEDPKRKLREGLGLDLVRKGDWTVVNFVESRKDAELAGLKKGDRLVAADTRSLRYLDLEAVQRVLIEPPSVNFTLQFERDIFVAADDARGFDALGLKTGLEYDGLVVRSVREDSPAAKAGFKARDFITAVNGQSTRYLSGDKIEKLMRDSGRPKTAFTVRRDALLTRK